MSQHALEQRDAKVPANVLVLDDDANILSAFEKFFQQEHCTMIGATTPAEAKRALEEHSVELLITDVRLQWRSGVTFFLEAKEMYPDLCIIVITGYSESISEQEVLALGADYFFLKPLDLAQLRTAVHHCLQRRGKPSTPRSPHPRYHRESDR
jgi:DNA-binding NtrC family response regulator